MVNWLKRKWAGLAFLAAYVGSVVTANELTSHLGLVSVGLGLTATAGTWAIGGAILTRDLLQDKLGRVAVWAAMLAGAGISYVLTSPNLAIASGVTFLLAEGLVYLAYTPLRKAGWARAVAVANAVGVVADTLIFLWLAGFPLGLPTVEGQFFAKVLVTAIALTIRGGVTVRRAVVRRAVAA